MQTIETTPVVVLQFQGTKTIGETYEIHVKNLMEAVTLAAGNAELLRSYELELMGALAKVQNLIYQQTKR